MGRVLCGGGTCSVSSVVGGRCYCTNSGANSINQHDSLLCFAVESNKI